MEYQPLHAKTGDQVERQGMEDRFGWQAAIDARPASFNANSKPPLMTTMGHCFPQSLASSPNLDPSLMNVECWKMSMPEQSPYRVMGDSGACTIRSMELNDSNVGFELFGSGNADPRYPRDGNTSQSPMPQVNKNQVQGAHISPTDNDNEYLMKPTWLPANSPGNSFPPPSSARLSHNHHTLAQSLVPWQVETTASFEAYAPFAISTQAMMVPIPSASYSYTPSRSQSHSSAMEYRSPSFETNIFPITDSSPEEEYQEVPRNVPFGRDLNSVFVFSSSGANDVFFSPLYPTAIGETSGQRQHSAQDVQNEEPNVTWTKVEAMPTNSVYLQEANGHLASTHARSESSAGTLSMFHLHTPPDLPTIQEAPPRMEELIVNIEASPSVQPSKGKRKAFGPAERKKVKKVRENGACFSCRAKKVACTEEGICSRCLRAMKQDPQLACQVCLRNKFKDIYIGVKDIHGSLLARKGQLSDILASLVGTPRQVEIWVGDGPNAAKLKLQVMQCQSAAAWATCRWKCLKKVSGIYITNHFVEDQRYVIVPSSVPNIDRLDLFGRKILSFSDGTHSGRITPLLDRFLLHYCRPNRPSRLRLLANETLRIASLNGLVAYGFINLHDGSYDLLSRPPSQDQRYVSETVLDQIRIQAAEGFGTAEEHIFYELDNLRQIIASDEHNRIVAGICLLRLMILYRERMVRDEIRLGLPRHGKRKTGHQTRLEKAAFMYKRLTVVYGTLCSGSDSPMAMDWQSESSVKGGEEQQALRTAFAWLQVAYEEFCGEKLTQQHDDVFKRLIVEPAMKDKGKRKDKGKGEKAKGVRRP